MNGVQTVVGQVEPLESAKHCQRRAGDPLELVVGQAERLERRSEPVERGVRNGLDLAGRHDQPVQRNAVEHPGRKRAHVLHGTVQKRYGRRAGQMPERLGNGLERRFAAGAA